MNGSQDERITRSIHQMESHPEQAFSVPDIARRAGMSISLFNKKFKDAVGLSPLKYIISLRLEKVKFYLRTTNLSISEIAYITGFSDSNYMIKYFHQHFSITPARYRKMNFSVR